MMDRPPAGGLFGPPVPQGAPSASAPALVGGGWVPEQPWDRNPLLLPIDGTVHTTAITLPGGTRSIGFTVPNPGLIAQLQVIGQTSGIDYAARSGVSVDQRFVVRNLLSSIDSAVNVMITTVPGSGTMPVNLAFVFDQPPAPARDPAPTTLAIEPLASGIGAVSRSYTMPDGDNTLIFTEESPGGGTTLQIAVTGAVSGRSYYSTFGTTSEVAGVPAVAQITDPRDLTPGGVKVVYTLGATGSGQSVVVQACQRTLAIPMPWQAAQFTASGTLTALAIGSVGTLIAGFVGPPKQRIYLHNAGVDHDANAAVLVLLVDMGNSNAEIGEARTAVGPGRVFGPENWAGAPVPTPGGGLGLKLSAMSTGTSDDFFFRITYSLGP